MRRLSLGISLAISIRLIGLVLIRAVDVDILLNPNIAYMIIACILFASGLASIYSVLGSLKAPEKAQFFLSGQVLPAASASKRRLVTIGLLC